MQENLSPAIQAQLVRRWELDPGGKSLTWEDLEGVLGVRIAQLLDEDFERLVNIMYRLDIPEHRFHAAMSGNSSKIPERLTQLVLEREYQRIQTWNKYQNDKSND